MWIGGRMRRGFVGADALPALRGPRMRRRLSNGLVRNARA